MEKSFAKDRLLHCERWPFSRPKATFHILKDDLLESRPHQHGFHPGKDRTPTLQKHKN